MADDRPISSGSCRLVAAAGAIAGVLLLATLVAPPVHQRKSKPVPFAAVETTQAAANRRSRKPRDEAFCRRCEAACAERKSRCLANSRTPTQARLCPGVQAACIIRCNEGLGCALPPPSIVGGRPGP